MNKIKCLIIDDEPKARELIKIFLSKIDYAEILGEAKNGLEAVKLIEDLKPDLIFLDIQMPKLTGFEVLELIQHKPQIIFTTAYDEYALKAFEENATDYLLKPFSFERFKESIERVNNNQKTIEPRNNKISPNPKLRRIVVKEGNNINLINFDEIESLRASDDYVIIKTDNAEFVKNQTMNHYEESMCDGNFIRVHRSSIVNIDKIKSMAHVAKENYELIMLSGERIKISKSNIKKIKEILNF